MTPFPKAHIIATFEHLCHERMPLLFTCIQQVNYDLVGEENMHEVSSFVTLVK